MAQHGITMHSTIQPVTRTGKRTTQICRFDGHFQGQPGSASCPSWFWGWLDCWQIFLWLDALCVQGRSQKFILGGYNSFTPRYTSPILAAWRHRLQLVHKIIFRDWFWEGVYTDIPPVATPLFVSLIGGITLHSLINLRQDVSGHTFCQLSDTSFHTRQTYLWLLLLLSVSNKFTFKLSN